MAIGILTNEAPTPAARGFIVTSDEFFPRYRRGDTVMFDDKQPVVGDEVLCLQVNNHFVIGDLERIASDSLVLSDSCHVRPEPNMTVRPANYWRIVGCLLGETA